MMTFACEMGKPSFLGMIKKVLEGDPRPGHVNSELGIGLSSFDGWDDWFTYGEHHGDQPMKVECHIERDNAKAIQFLKDHGFVGEGEA